MQIESLVTDSEVVPIYGKHFFSVLQLRYLCFFFLYLSIDELLLVMLQGRIHL